MILKAMEKMAAAVSGRRAAVHGGALLAVGALSFALTWAPHLLSDGVSSLGGDGDGAAHFAFQLKLRDPSLFPDDFEFNDMLSSSRSAFEFSLHRAVVGIANLTGADLLALNLLLAYLVHLAFLAGCYRLGLAVTGGALQAGLFAGASSVLSQGYFAWWGIGFGAVCPKFFALAAVPYFVSAHFERLRDGREDAGVFLALGVLANFYPVMFLHLAFILLAVGLSVRRPGAWRSCAVGAAAFAAAASPVLWRSFRQVLPEPGGAALDPSVLDALLRKHYGFAFGRVGDLHEFFFSHLSVMGMALLTAWLALRGAPVDRRSRFCLLLSHGLMMSMVLLHQVGGYGYTFHIEAIRDVISIRLLNALAVGGYVAFAGYLVGLVGTGAVESLARSDRRGPAPYMAAFFVWTSALTLTGLVAGNVSKPLVSLLLHRSSALLYIPLYLGCAWLVRAGAAGKGGWKASALAAAVFMSLNGVRHTSLWYRVFTGRPPQMTAPYRELTDWARERTPKDALFMIPYPCPVSFFAFRAYAERGVVLQESAGEVVVSNPRGAMRFWSVSREMEEAWSDRGRPERILALARKYGVDYVIDANHLPPLPGAPVVYRNAWCRVQAVEQAPR